MRIAFRADANPFLGSGHVMRCISIATALKDIGVQCLFITADDNADILLKKSSFEAECLNSSWKQLDSELPRLLDTLENFHIDCIVVDHYYVTQEYLTALKNQTKLFYIDDVNAFDYPCDTLINYNIYAGDWAAHYTMQHNSSRAKVLLGPCYAPLRKEFSNIPVRKYRRSVSDVLVSTGGADSAHVFDMLLKLIKKHSDWNDIHFHFIVGTLNTMLTSIEHKADSITNVQIHCNVQNMSHLMCQCDMAISAAGSTLYELCACGLPTVTYIMADNQIPGAQAFASKGLMLNAGDCRKNGFESSMIMSMQRLISSAELRANMSKRMQTIVDGKGAYRLAEEIVRLAAQ